MQPPVWVPSENIAKVARLPVFSRAWNLSHRNVGELALTMERGAKRKHLPSRPDADRAIRISSLGDFMSVIVWRRLIAAAVATVSLGAGVSAYGEPTGSIARTSSSPTPTKV